MSEKKKHIMDTIGNKLREGEIKVPENEWNAIAKKIKFRDFFFPKFSAFNIYYLSAIVAASTITVYAVVKKNNEARQEIEKQPVETLIVPTDTLVIDDTLAISPEYDENVEFYEEKPEKGKKTQNILIEESKESEMIKEIKSTSEPDVEETIEPNKGIGTLTIEEDKDRDSKSNEKESTKRIKQYIYQSDTIVVHDTIEKKIKKKKIIIDR